jgi:hypothetical protein
VDDREKAMTELDEAVADVSDEAREQRLLRIAAALYHAAVVQGVRQRDLVKRTGYARETIRRHVEDERIRRGEMPPTERYLSEQERKLKRRRDAS